MKSTLTLLSIITILFIACTSSITGTEEEAQSRGSKKDIYDPIMVVMIGAPYDPNGPQDCYFCYVNTEVAAIYNSQYEQLPEYKFLGHVCSSCLKAIEKVYVKAEGKDYTGLLYWPQGVGNQDSVVTRVEDYVHIK